MQKNIICIFKNGKKSIFAPEKNCKLSKSCFFQSENCIFGSFKLFSCEKIDFLPFLKWQKMCFCTFQIALFSNFRADESSNEIQKWVEEVDRVPSSTKNGLAVDEIFANDPFFKSEPDFDVEFGCQVETGKQIISK